MLSKEEIDLFLWWLGMTMVGGFAIIFIILICTVIIHKAWTFFNTAKSMVEYKTAMVFYRKYHGNLKDGCIKDGCIRCTEADYLLAVVKVRLVEAVERLNWEMSDDVKNLMERISKYLVDGES